MKKTIKSRILTIIRNRIISIPKDKPVPKYHIIAARAVIWISGIKSRIASLSLIVFISNLCFVFLTSRSEAHIFSGFLYRKLAVRYADKRSDISKVNELCGGKRHYVIQYDKGALIVLNKIEMNKLKAKRILSKNYNCTDVFENAYYVTK